MKLRDRPMTPLRRQRGFFLNPYRFSVGGPPVPPPLDAFAAFWGVYGLQRYLTAYTGALIRVRRSSDNAEADIPFGSDNLLDRIALSAHCGANSGYVVTIYDQTGNARHFTQATPTKQGLIWETGTYLGEIETDNVDDFYATPNDGQSPTEILIHLVGRASQAIASNGSVSSNHIVTRGHFSARLTRASGRETDQQAAVHSGSSYSKGAFISGARDGCVHSYGLRTNGGSDYNNHRCFFNGVDEGGTHGGGTAGGGAMTGPVYLGSNTSGTGTTALRFRGVAIVNSNPSDADILNQAVALRPNRFVDVLDGHTSGLLVAASMHHRLLSAYSGPLARVRRSSDNSELDIGANATGHFDAVAFAAFIGGGAGYVVKIYDQSGGGKHFEQATTAAQPPYVHGATRRATFDYTDDRFISPALGVTPAALTMFLSGRGAVNPFNTYSNYMVLSDGTTTETLLRYTSSRRLESYVGNGANYSLTNYWVNLADQCLAVVYNRGEASKNDMSKVYNGGYFRTQDGTAHSGTAVAGTFSNLNLVLGALHNGTEPGRLQFGVAVVYQGALSAGDILKISRKLG